MRNKLIEAFGEIDIYLFDQLLKGRFDDSKTVLDVGCGFGRNLYYFLKNGYEVFGVDQNHEAIDEVKKLAQQISPAISPDNFKVGLVEQMDFPSEAFDVVICSAVLHFAKDHQHFGDMLSSCWRTLKHGGYFFARLASTIGIEGLVIDRGNGRYLLPDGSERYLVNQDLLLRYTKHLNGDLFENIKTTNVQNLRCMTTWCVYKNFI
jgi:2-polyprenyl-3-methyl-5-hydroxy-6-metoxy-1,4-benzoquinol methylase